MLLSKRNELFEQELFNSCAKKDRFREFIAAIFRILIKTSDIQISMCNFFLKEEVKAEFLY